MPALQHLRSFFSRFYQVPWCVPAWGWAEFCATVGCVLNGAILRGAAVDRFTQAVRERLGMPYALPFNRGRVAIEVALRAMGIGAGDEVVMPSYVCRTVAEATVHAGARPIFADVNSHLHVTPETVRTALTGRTRCVIVPHLFGNSAPIDEIECMLAGTGIGLIDDAAQSFGTRRNGRPVGTFGTCGIVSCGPAKAIAGTGGGVLVTRSADLYRRAKAVPLRTEAPSEVFRRVLAFWVWRRFRGYTLPCYVILRRFLGPSPEEPYVRARLPNLEAAIALAQCRSLDDNASKRRANARRMLSGLGPLARYNIVHPWPENVTLKVVVVLPPDGPDAAEIIRLLGEAGVECQRGYSPLHLEGIPEAVSLPTTEALWRRVVCVPVEVPVKRFWALVKAMVIAWTPGPRLDRPEGQPAERLCCNSQETT